VAQDVLASQEGLCSMEYVSTGNRKFTALGVSGQYPLVLLIKIRRNQYRALRSEECMAMESRVLGHARDEACSAKRARNVAKMNYKNV
jgi:hypothetical protein